MAGISIRTRRIRTSRQDGPWLGLVIGLEGLGPRLGIELQLGPLRLGLGL